MKIHENVPFFGTSTQFWDSDFFQFLFLLVVFSSTHPKEHFKAISIMITLK